MEALLLCNKGIEAFSCSELRKYKVTDVSSVLGGVVFSYTDVKELFKIAYGSLSCSTVMALVGSFNVDSLEGLSLSTDLLVKEISSLDFSAWLDSSRSLCVRTNLDVTGISHRDLESKLGAGIVDSTSCTVNLSKPDVLVYVTLLGNTVFVGVDLCGVDLAKRDYRIFSGRENVKAPIAAFAVWKAEVKEKETVIDPFCRNGTVLIEAVHLLSSKSVHYFHKDKFLFCSMPQFSSVDFDELFSEQDKLITEPSVALWALDENFQHLNSAKKNAKIADVEKQISFSRTSPEWLDTKFKKQTVEHLVSFLPQLSRRLEVKQVEKHLRELFYQASYVLSSTGNVVVITKDVELLGKFAKQYSFKKTYSQEVFQGGQSYVVLVFERV